MHVWIATWAPERFQVWLQVLRGEGLQIGVGTPDLREPSPVPQTAPEVVLLDLADNGFQVDAFRKRMAQLYPGASVGLIGVAPRQALHALTGEELDDVVEVSAAPEEVLYRVQRLAGRRSGLPPLPDGPAEIELGELTIHPAEARVLIAGQPVALRPREFELLRFLATRPDRVFRREDLVREVWGPHYHGSLRTVDMHIRRLRHRLGAFGERHVQTVRRVGYRMAAPGTEPPGMSRR